jgi:4-diphosphocytidyl-2-C-methyl-D-erythritol kinase
VITERAFAKLNLVLHVGPPSGGMHPLCSLFASVELADDLEVRELPAGAADAVICPGVAGENLAARALRLIRVRLGGELAPLEVRIEKRIPVAAGLGGGSADAAAALRAANAIAGEPLAAGDLRVIASALGSDVPSQVEPRHALVTGTGEQVEPLELPALAVVLVPQARGLRAGEVYAELDRLRGWREHLDPEALRRLAGRGPEALAAAAENDLGAAAISLRPDLAGPLDALRSAGALGAGVSGSGPTCFGLFGSDTDARRAAARVGGALVTKLRRA